jgi:hypothetical protein
MRKNSTAKVKAGGLCFEEPEVRALEFVELDKSEKEETFLATSQSAAAV